MWIWVLIIKQRKATGHQPAWELSVKIKAVLILDDLPLDGFPHLAGHHFTRLYAHVEQFFELCYRYFVAIEVDVGQALRFLQVNSDEFAVLSLFFLVDEIEHGYILKQSGRRCDKKIFHRDTSVHQRKWYSVKGCRTIATIRLQYEDLEVNLTPWIVLEHQDLLEYWFEHSAELFHLEVFLYVCFVLHGTEVGLEESYVQDALVLTLDSA